MKQAGARNIIVLLGGPGAGKGTQSEAITRWLGIPRISTGELLRSEVARESALGSCVAATMDSGGLISDDTVNDLVATRIRQDDCARGFVLDGYPRSVEQAVALLGIVAESDRLIVVDIHIGLENVIQRLAGRWTCSSCGAIYHDAASPPIRPGLCDRCGRALSQRSDDRQEVIRERFKAYEARSSSLAQLFQRCGVHRRIDGMQPVEQVSRHVRAVLEGEVLQDSLRDLKAAAAYQAK